MNNSKFTPGPWHVLHMNNNDGVEVGAHAIDIKTENGWYDAELIAAAPEMLDALEYCLGQMKQRGENGAGRDYLEKTIAKATGATND